MNESNVYHTTTSAVDLARITIGQDIEIPSIHINGEDAKTILKRENQQRFNQSVDEFQEKFQKHVDDMKSLGKKIAEDFSNVEIMPLTSYVLISPFEKNPFQKMAVDKSGLILDTGGLAPTYKSQETGEVEEEREYVRVGMVTETGTECKFLKPGDIVFYNIASEVQVPFYKFGFVIVAEQRIIAVVNEGLSKRKEDIVNEVKADE